MQQKLMGRLLVVLGVVILALYYTLPSVRVINYKMTADPQDPKRLRELEDQSWPLGAVPIRFGLDLEGGTDVTLSLDEEAMVRQNLTKFSGDIRREMQRKRISAKIDLDQQRRCLILTLARPEDSREARIILERYGQFEPWDTAALEQGRKVTLTLQASELIHARREAVDSALKVLRNRVDAMGLIQPIVVKQGENRLRVQMPGVADPEAVIKNIIRPAQLEFRFLRKTSDEDIAKLFEPEPYKEVCAYIAKNKKLPDPLPLKPDAEIPAGYILAPGEYSEHADRTGQPATRYKPFLVSEKIELGGESLRNAYVYVNQASFRSPYEIHLVFNRPGAVAFADLTRQHVGDNLAIILDNYLFSAPVIQEAIPQGNAQITGSFTQEEARDLSLVLKAGALSANFQPSQSYVIEATLGTDSIRKGVNALLVGSLAVIVFMIGYYGTAGAVAIVALAINVLMIIAILVLAGATLTLSGIGGILLTIGMAVDANVLIYERIREEKATSRGLKVAISRGFQRAFSVIFDSNLTTLITTLVLLQFGTGSVQGFALTTTFGIFATLFTGLFCTHILIDLWVQWRNNLSTGWFTIFRNPKIDAIGLRHYAYGLSAIVIAIGIVTTIAKGGLRPGVEFTGGLMADVSFEKPTSEDEIKSIVGKYCPIPVVQRVRGENRYIVRVSTGKHAEGAPEVEQNQQKVEEALRKALSEHPGAANVGGVTSISPEIGKEFISAAIVAVLASWIGILVYLWFRFELVFGAGAVIALVHDVCLTVGLLTLFGQEISLDVVAGLLILIGYSTNDTIVVFDRIRETIRTTYGIPYREMLNQSINQSLNRTTITSLCTLFTTSIMLLLGGPGLQPFALTLTIGIITGTYSSDFVATPVVYEYHEWRRRRQPQAA